MSVSFLPSNRLLPTDNQQQRWGSLLGASLALAISETAARADRPLIVLAGSAAEADRLESEIRFFGEADFPVLHFPEWETLAWDSFSPHQDIISERLRVLAELPALKRGVLVASASSLLQRLPPQDYVRSRAISLREGQTLDREAFIDEMVGAGYARVPQVGDHGDIAVRGSLVDLFPMGYQQPVRVDFFDDEIESLRFFSPETQLSGDKIPALNILPAREVPLDEEAVKSFRHRYRERFEGQPAKSRVYRDVSDGIAHGGIEYYLPLFFDETSGLLDYLPDNALAFLPDDMDDLMSQDWHDISERYEMCSLDPERPVLKPDETFHTPDVIAERLSKLSRIAFSANSLDGKALNLSTRMSPALRIESRFEDPASALMNFLQTQDYRVLFTTDSAGRREQLLELLAGRGLDISRAAGWREYLDSGKRIGIAIAPLEHGVLLPDASLAIVSEQQLWGERVKQRKRRRETDPEAIIRQLDDLAEGSPVIHAEYGVGRYLGLITLEAGGVASEFLHLEYADGDKLYVPVDSLDLISRYTGASPENAPLHRLGSDQWSKARKRAIQRIRDVAAELLDVYARRAARPGHRFRWPESDYRAFEEAFPFDPTEDQARTITEVLGDLESEQPMDRVVCGDVGFGKTEVALRATFAAVLSGKQVAVLVPTTLLAQQHGQNFADRFAEWPIRTEVISRFQSPKKIKEIVEAMKSGRVDVVIGTHRLLQHTKSFKDVGLVVIDEEQRFGVRHKEAIRSLRSEIDVLTLTATPIPRTLNMALGGIRDMSLITTPPSERLSVKTFVGQWNKVMIREACLREIKRGGQVYFIHNRVEDIHSVEEKLAKLVPEASIRVGHGQMPERELEQVMLDFSHRRFNVLLCTTIVESGIDVPTANTIIINRADRFGLAQLHQLRGRVGRSHHRAYAYLIAPPKKAMTPDAIKRLEAIDSLEDLGSGFTLATHDLEIRGAGELLGDEQSGQIHEIGFALYMELLGKAVQSLKAGKEPDLDAPLESGVEIKLHVPALLPDDYVPDVHLRLILYKRISSCENEEQIRELQVELIDRFGLLPEAAKNLMQIAGLKRKAAALGIEKIDAADASGYMNFSPDAKIDPVALVRLVQTDSQRYRLQGSHKLSFKAPMTDISQRFETVSKLMDTLTPK